MIVLFFSPTAAAGEAEDWRTRLAALDASIELRVWPDTGPEEEIEAVLAWAPTFGVLKRFRRLRAIFSLGAGVDHLVRDPELPLSVPIIRLVDDGLTQSVAEYVLLHVLRYHRRMPELEAQQRVANWDSLVAPWPWERRVGLMGLGVLGSAAAAVLERQGFDVAGWSRTPKDLPNVKCFCGSEGLTPFLERTEILACLLPLTPATDGIIDAHLLQCLPKGAFLINAGRGRHVVEADLLAALDRNEITHATLDVFQSEPLPRNHPFWSHPRITVTPHVAGKTPAETAARVVLDGLRAVQKGKLPRHLVERERGY